jgi:hypothetical protein
VSTCAQAGSLCSRMIQIYGIAGRGSCWAIVSGVFQSMDALRFGTAAAAWLIRGQNQAAIVASLAEAGAHTVVHLFGFWHLPAGAPPSRRFHWILEVHGMIQGEGGPLLRIYNWMRRPRWFVGLRRWPGIPPLCGRRRQGRPGELSRSGPPS